MNSIWNNNWNKNIALFKKRFSSLAQIYESTINHFSEVLASEENNDFFSPWLIASTKSDANLFTASEQKLTLHSSYNPRREAQQAMTKLLNPEAQTYIFLGFGIGYHVCALAEQITEESIILIEPNEEYFFAALALLDWSSVFQVPKLIIALGCPTESIISLIENSFSDSHEAFSFGPSIISQAVYFTLPAFTVHQQEYFNTVKTLIERNKHKDETNAATYKKFAHLWCKNSKANLKHLGKCRTLNSFLSEWIPSYSDFLVVAAGPSLETILPKISQLKTKMTIVCVETALRALLREKVQPDFVIITDPQYWAYKHIAELKAPESRLICPISVYPAVFRFDNNNKAKNFKEILVCSDLFPISRFYEHQLGSFGELGSGGSVASAAWSFAHLCNARRIFFAGLDLSFPTKQTHIRGSSAEQTFHTVSNRMNTVEKMSITSMYSANPEYSKDYEGKTVLTDSRMKMFAWWFESKIAACNPDELKNYSFCKESMKIPGVEYFSLDDYEKLPVEHQSLIPANQCINPQSKDNWEKLLTEACKLYTKALNELINLTGSAIEKCIINPPNLQEELALIKKQIAENPLKEIFQMINTTIPREASPLQGFSIIKNELKYFL
ncbi:MAG: DUF115 domain-containing protein [Treponema sp.]|nr:DUF115 domain-containing protein [Treponema sp.]